MVPYISSVTNIVYHTLNDTIILHFHLCLGVPYQLMEVRFDIKGASQVLSGALDYIGYISQMVSLRSSSSHLDKFHITNLTEMHLYLFPIFYVYYNFIYLGFHITFNTAKVISRQVVLWAEETSTYSWSTFCTVSCRQ